MKMNKKEAAKYKKLMRKSLAFHKKAEAYENKFQAIYPKATSSMDKFRQAKAYENKFKMTYAKATGLWQEAMAIKKRA